MADPLVLELAALRAEIACLRQVMSSLVQALERHPPQTAASHPAVSSAVSAAVPAALPATAASTSQLLARRNAERLNGEVRRRTALGLDPADDTEVDLLIDRLHDLADPA
ncbi:hypothetical protein [Synechococcus sp. CS-1328]|uniref:hypothetical protein n=1 Tax=Synechococcus sp. CS-1328 TaxID=2847976 RepID=UPI00223AABE8|nr:hypothetical protein [Synechococcus sp. CS-1328]MCT0226219.1 hypothetical protein [Synechococcus sp. CS-1328]